MTVGASLSGKSSKPETGAVRTKILLCAPSNTAVDEVCIALSPLVDIIVVTIW